MSEDDDGELADPLTLIGRLIFIVCLIAVAMFLACDLRINGKRYGNANGIRACSFNVGAPE